MSDIADLFEAPHELTPDQLLMVAGVLSPVLQDSDAQRIERLTVHLGPTVTPAAVLDIVKLVRAIDAVRYQPLRTRLRWWWNR